MATIYNFGSINTDHVYRLGHFPDAGETLAALDYTRGLGGKGANQSVALAKAGAEVFHIGAVGSDGQWMVERMRAAGVDCRHVEQSETASGHAIINVDARGENTIVLYAGANRALSPDHIAVSLAAAQVGDLLVMQNETAHQLAAARFAQERGLKVVYSAAPFEAEAVREVLPYVWLLLLNALEAEQLSATLECPLEALPVPQVLVTRGAEGAVWYDLEAGEHIEMPAFKVAVEDTTGAGDTFAGYLTAAIGEGLPRAAVMRLAAGAAALKVTRAGAADAIPTRAEVEAFLRDQPSE